MKAENMSDKELVNEVTRRLNEKVVAIEDLEGIVEKHLLVNRKLKETYRIKSTFLSMIRNEFNNPLSSLLNFVDFLHASATEDQKEMVKLMHSELRRMDFCLNNIFTAAEIEAGEANQELLHTNLEEIIQDLKPAIQDLTEIKELSLETNIELKEGFISDPQKLFIVLRNLLVNACKYAEKSSTIVITAKEEEHHVEIVVKNNGNPIADKDREIMYDSFTSFDDVNSLEKNGLGLGLAIVRGVLDLLGGSVTDSHANGVTTFHITVPKGDISQVASTGLGHNGILFDQDQEGMLEF